MYRPIPFIPSSNLGQSITALAFDPLSDVLWAGTSAGTVIGHAGTSGARGVSFPVGSHVEVKKLIAEENSVKALPASGEGVGSWTKGGMNKWYFR